MQYVFNEYIFHCAPHFSLSITTEQLTCLLQVVEYCLSTLKSSGLSASLSSAPLSVITKITIHNHLLQLIESRSPIMLNLKAWPADYEDSERCIHSGMVTKRGVFVFGQGQLMLPIVLTN